MHKSPYNLTLYSFGSVGNTDTFKRLEDALQRAAKHVDKDGGSLAIILDSWGKHVETLTTSPHILS